MVTMVLSKTRSKKNKKRKKKVELLQHILVLLLLVIIVIIVTVVLGVENRIVTDWNGSVTVSHDASSNPQYENCTTPPQSNC